MIKKLLLFFLFSTLIPLSTIYSQQANWTFMVYLAADNDLEEYAIGDFNEMELIGSTSSVNILVQMDRSDEYDNSNGNWSDTRRYRVIRDYDTETISSPVLMNLGEVNMGNPNSVVDFINWGVTNYPAQNYCLVFWNHGGGWRYKTNTGFDFNIISSQILPNAGRISDLVSGASSTGVKRPELKNPFDSSVNVFKDVCYDEYNGDFLSSDEIGRALGQASARMNVIGYDACLMSMIENAYEVRGKVDYIVASEEVEPGYGWPYDTILNQLVANPNSSASQLSTSIVTMYQNFYTGISGNSQTLSALKMSELTTLMNNFNTFVTSLNNAQPWGAIDQIYSNVDKYQNESSVDLYDFVQKLIAIAGNGSLTTSGNNLMQSINNFVISNFTESGHPGAHGLAIYFPLSSAFDARYSNNFFQVDFPMDTQWDEFLQNYFLGGSPAQIYDPYEPNDVHAQAYGPIVANQIYEGYITDQEDIDYFKFTTASNFSIDILLTVPADFDLFFLKKQGDSYVVLVSSSNLGSNQEEIQQSNLVAGEYYIAVTPYEVSNEPYQLTHSIIGGSGIINLELSYDDGDPEYFLYSEREDINEGIACSFSPPIAPARLLGFWYNIVELDAVPGNGDDGSFWVFGSDYYGFFLPEDFLYFTPYTVGWNYVDLSAYNVTLYGDFFAGMYFDTQNTPGIGWDTNTNNGVNLIFTDTGGIEDWYPGEGTFFIRAVISVNNEITGVDEIVELTPSSYSLNQNYPNPFNPSTKISYSLTEESKVTLQIYNALGQSVAKLVDEIVPAGINEVEWNSKALASGVYFYRLQVNSLQGKEKFVATKKMVLMR